MDHAGEQLETIGRLRKQVVRLSKSTASGAPGGAEKTLHFHCLSLWFHLLKHGRFSGAESLQLNAQLSRLQVDPNSNAKPNALHRTPPAPPLNFTSNYCAFVAKSFWGPVVEP